MVTLLAKLCIKDYKNYEDTKVRERYGILSGAVGIALNVVLFILKFFAGLLSHSIAITADAFNNLSDAGSSVITLLGFKLSSAEPDSEHPFGHGRIEYLSGLLVSAIIVIMGFELLRDSVDKIIHPQDMVFSPLVIAILIASIAVKMYMAYYNTSLAKKIDSAAMKATATDSMSDSLATFIVLISTIFCEFTSLHIDGYCGVIVAAIVIWAGLSAGKETVDPLLGQPPEQGFVDRIEDIVMAQPGIIGVHDLVVHNYGPGRVMISLHAEVPANIDVMESHDVIDRTEHILKQQLHCEAVIHMDPVVTDDPRVDELRDAVKDVVVKWNENASIHDFRVVFGNTHTNLVFDIVVPYQMKDSEKDIQKAIQTRVWEAVGKQYFVAMDIDRQYV